MASLAYQQAGIPGAAAVTFTAAAVGGDTVAPNDRGVLLVRNASGGAINVTVVVPGNTKYGQADPDVVLPVADGAIRAIGPFSADLVDPTDRRVDITYSAVTSVTVAAVAV